MKQCKTSQPPENLASGKQTWKMGCYQKTHFRLCCSDLGVEIKGSTGITVCDLERKRQAFIITTLSNWKSSEIKIQLDYSHCARCGVVVSAEDSKGTR